MSFFNADIRVTGSDGLILKDLLTNATTPASGLGTVYLNDGTLYIRTSDGTDTSLSGGGGGGGGSTAADDITLGDSTVNISTTSGSIIMHSVNNSSNSIVMTSNSGANETIEIHNVQGTSNSSILLKAHTGGTTIEGPSTNIDNVSNKLVVSSSTPTSNGSGFAPLYFNSFITEAFGDKVTTFHIDTTNLVVASNTGNGSVVVGKNDSNDAYFGRYNTDKMGTIYNMEMFCLETPTPDTPGEAIDIGFSDSYASYNLSNGTTYYITGGSGSAAELTFDMTTNGYIKEIFLSNQGSGYLNNDMVQIYDDSFQYLYFVYVIDGSEKRVAFSTYFFSDPGTNLSTTTEMGYTGSGLTVDLSLIRYEYDPLYNPGNYYYYPYAVSVNNSGSGYDNSIVVTDGSTSYYLGTTSASASNRYGLGYLNTSVQTGSINSTDLTSTTEPVTAFTQMSPFVSSSLVDGDYFYLTVSGKNSSNTSITGGKFLIKMYGTSF